MAIVNKKNQKNGVKKIPNIPLINNDKIKNKGI